MDIRLEHNLSLAGLINSESLANLCRRFAELCGTSVSAADLDGSLLAGSPDLRRVCRPPGQAGGPCRVCHQEDPWSSDGRQKLETLHCRSGLSYLRIRVDNQFETAGHLVLGPFRQEPAESSADIESVPSLEASRAESLLRFLCTVVEEIVYANYQGYLVSKLNLQAHAEQLGELMDKDTELQRYEDTLEESKALRSLF